MKNLPETIDIHFEVGLNDLVDQIEKACKVPKCTFSFLDPEINRFIKYIPRKAKMTLLVKDNKLKGFYFST